MPGIAFAETIAQRNGYESRTPARPLHIRDRSTSLTVFGVLTLFAGVVFGLLTLVILKGHAVQSPHTSSLLSAVFIYGGMAVAFAWLGIGSMLARRWARALLLIISVSSLALGVFVITAMGVLWPGISHSIEQARVASGAAAASEPVKWGIFCGICVGSALFWVFPSAFGAFFYSRKSVKATCEARNPQACWTDRAPLPVIAASLFLAFGAVSMVTTAFSLRGVMPFCGVYLQGIPGLLLYALIFLLWSWLALGIYRLDTRAWWVGLVAMCIFPISGAITYHRQGVLTLYKLAGYTEAQMDRLQHNPVFSGDWFIWIMLAGMVPWIVYFLFIKRYFRRA